MFDVLIGLAIGYFIRGSMTSKPTFDMILAWDPQTLGWRTVAQHSKLDTNRRYIAALEIDPGSQVPEKR